MKKIILFTLSLLLVVSFSRVEAQGLAGSVPRFDFRGMTASGTLTTLNTNVSTHEPTKVTAVLNSQGYIDQLSQIGYKVYRNGVLLDSLSDYGTFEYRIRTSPLSYYTAQLSAGAGLVSVNVGSTQVKALTLGFLDMYCASRNRNVEMTITPTVPGDYRLVLDIYKCSNVGSDIPFINSFTANTKPGCDGQPRHKDKYAVTCDNAELWSSQEMTLNVTQNPTMPEVALSGLLGTYERNTPVNVTAELVSNGQVDLLCGLKYELYRNNQLVSNISNVGNMSFSVREQGNAIYTQDITTGSGMVAAELNGLNFGAFSLGIFDSQCTDRNRPIDFTGSFFAPGEYKLVTELMSCNETRIALPSTFVSSCDNATHTDAYAARCTKKQTILHKESVFTVVPGTPEVNVSGLLPSYERNQDLAVTAEISSAGLTDQLCGLKYELYRNNTLVNNIASVGTLAYSVRENGSALFSDDIISGSGMISASGGGLTVGAFSLGIFDTECADRNRPVLFEGSFFAPGNYKLKTSLVECTNTPLPVGTTYTSTCDNTVHQDFYAQTCTEGTEIVAREDVFTVNAGTPEVIVTGLLPEYEYNNLISVSAEIRSAGLTDSLCGLKYEIFRNDVLVTDMASIGSMSYTIRENGTSIYTDEITAGSGMISASAGGMTLGAFTLGIFDTECVNRNRPVLFEGRLAHGDYKLKTSLVGCMETPIALGASFLSSCDNTTHFDKYAATCTSTRNIVVREDLFSVLPANPTVTIAGLSSTYDYREAIEVTAQIHSDGYIDSLCGLKYEIFRNDVLVTDMASIGSMSYTIRENGTDMYTDVITAGSGMISASAGGMTLGAFTLGIFDTDCVDRNRPVVFAGRLVDGDYKLKTTLVGCTETPIALGTSFLSTCDNETHFDAYASTCTSSRDIIVREDLFSVLSANPTVEVTGLLAEYVGTAPINVTAQIHSDGYIDSLCGLRYSFYKGGDLINDLTEVADMKFKVRSTGNIYHEQIITEGSGMLSINVLGEEYGAFTLGIFDDICVNRNRPVSFFGNFFVRGDYKLVTELVKCTNVGIDLGTTFTSTCDGEVHSDFGAETCTAGSVLFTDEREFTIKSGLSANGVETSTFKVYPSPFDSQLTIESDVNTVIQVINGLGQVVMTENIRQGKQTINVASLKSGMYFIQHNNKMHKVVKK